MTPSEAVDQLPAAHALALRLEEAGADTEVMGQALGIETESVGPLLRVARAKLLSILDQAGAPDPDRLQAPGQRLATSKDLPPTVESRDRIDKRTTPPPEMEVIA